MFCKQCEGNEAYIQTAEDSNFKEVYCPVCNWKQWLKHYNQKGKKNDPTNTGNNQKT